LVITPTKGNKIIFDKLKPHQMKKTINFTSFILIAIILSSCATVFHGPVTSYQKTKPKDGEEQRSVRVGALLFNIFLFWPGAIVDFATGAIYKPEPKK